MRVPLSWLTEYAPIDAAASGDVTEVARRLTAAGFEVESVERVGHDISGVVVGQVTSIEELTGFRKPIRYCSVSYGGSADQQVICGAVNFAVGDRVPLALPGARLAGGFEIGVRKAYGRDSAGMICSADELGLGGDHTGILLLDRDAPLGADFATFAALADDVLEVNVTPDKGYGLSVRGLARELAIAYGVPFADPADLGRTDGYEHVSPEVYPASIEDPTGCDRFTLREVRGVDQTRPTPVEMLVRLARCGVRSVSLAVDLTNYLMIETGQPLHAFDRAKLTGPVVVRRARPGEKLETLDHVVRALDPDDILITDSSGPISMAGTMGGVSTELSASTRDVVLEAAHFSASGTARMSRRHRLFSEASARFERGVDAELGIAVSARAAALLAKFGGGAAIPGCTHARLEIPRVSIVMSGDYPDRVAGLRYGTELVCSRLEQVGCTVTDLGCSAPESGRSGGVLEVIAPPWRHDLTDPADLAEEVIRLEGYETIPVRAPRAPAGRGLTARQRLRRAVGRSLAASGFVEVIGPAFTSVAELDKLGLPDGDQRRRAVTLANPISDDEPLVRTTLVPGLLRVLARNVGRGFSDVALFEVGSVARARPDGPGASPVLAVDRAPSARELTQVDAGLPDQHLAVAAGLAGNRELSGWWGEGRPVGWQDAVETARRVLAEYRALAVEVRATQLAPWHPGRCAALFVRSAGGANPAEPADPAVPAVAADRSAQVLVGYAGELHPRVVTAFGVPPATAVLELDLSAVEALADSTGPVQVPPVSGYPPATQDVALIVDTAVPAAVVAAALADGASSAGEFAVEEVRLFDVYTGAQVGRGRKSLAYTLRLRAMDRTLTSDEVATARDAAVAEAARRTGAVLRGPS